VPGFVSRVEELEVFRRAYALSLEVHRASLEFPRIEQFRCSVAAPPWQAKRRFAEKGADQVRRASKSICANLAEGFGRQQQSRPEFRRFLIMAIGSADEMQVWVLYCRDLGYVAQRTAERWQGEYREIARMLSGLHAGSSDNWFLITVFWTR
jgi:four helix bundle protein